MTENTSYLGKTSHALHFLTLLKLLPPLVLNIESNLPLGGHICPPCHVFAEGMDGEGLFTGRGTAKNLRGGERVNAIFCTIILKKTSTLMFYEQQNTVLTMHLTMLTAHPYKQVLFNAYL